MFGHNPAPLPPHALSCLPWMLSARRNPLPPAGQLPLWLAAVGTEGVRTSRAKADRRRRERGAIAVKEEEEGAVRQMSGFWWRRSMHLFSAASLALHWRSGEEASSSNREWRRVPPMAEMGEFAEGGAREADAMRGMGMGRTRGRREETKLAKTRRGEARKRKRGEEMIPKCYRAVKSCLPTPK